MRDTTRRNEIPYKARTQLRYSKGNSASWETAEGIRCTAYWFHWDQDRVSLFSEVHRPDVCLPSIGLRWIETRPHIEITTQDGTAIQFQGHAFEQRGQPIFVWYGVWDNELTPIDRHSHSGSRLRNTWQRKRVQSRQSIELILHGAHSWPDAEKTLAHWVSSAIKAASKSKHY